MKKIFLAFLLMGAWQSGAQDFKLMVQTGHQVDDKSLEKIAFSQDGKYLISAGNGGKVIIWEVASGAKVKEYKTQASEPLSVAVSPGGQWILASFYKSGRHGSNVLINMQTDEIKSHLKGGYRCSGAYFDDDHTLTMALGYSEVVKWDLDKELVKAKFKVDIKNYYEGHYALVVDPSRKFVVVSYKGLCYVLDYQTLAEVKKIKTDKELETRVTFSPSSKLMSISTVLGTAIYDAEAKFKKVNEIDFGYDARKEEDVRFWRLILGEFTEDEKRFRMSQYRKGYNGRWPGSMVEYDLATGGRVEETWLNSTKFDNSWYDDRFGYSMGATEKYNPMQAASQMIVSKDRKYLATIKDYTGELRIYNWQTGNIVQSMYPTSLEARGFAISADGRYIIMANKLSMTAYDMKNLKRYAIEKPKFEGLSDFMIVNDEGLLEYFTKPDFSFYKHDIPANHSKKVIDKAKNKYGAVSGFATNGDEKWMLFRPYTHGNDGIIRKYGKSSSAKNISFTPMENSGTFMAGSDNGQYAINYRVEGRSRILTYKLLNSSTNETTTGTLQGKGLWPHYKTTLSSEGRYLIFNGALYDLTGSEEPVAEFDDIDKNHEPIFMEGDQKIMYFDQRNQIYIYDIATNEKRSFIKSLYNLFDLELTEDEKWLFTLSESGIIQKWDVQKGTPLFSIITVDHDNFALIWEDNYYTMSIGAYPFVKFVNGLNGYGFENFDLVYNRPDIIAERMGRPDYLQKAYHKAYLKRLKKMGFEESQITKEIALPTVDLKKENIPAETKLGTQKISFSASDTQYALDRINVYVNNVPIYGAKGMSIEGDTKTILKELEIPLNNGANKIEVSVHNRAGFESPREQINITNQKQANTDLYIVAIGVSDYLQSEYNLTYAAKDAIDIIDTYTSNDELYDQITVLDYTNEKATRANILRAKSTLNKSKVDDEVILFIAGHGLLDEKMDYYFATHDVDFNNPAERGLLYEDLEGILDGIPARKKLMLIDACHSGEVDKDDATLVASSVGMSEGVSSRGFKMTIESKSKKLGLTNSFEIMNNLFTDLRRGTGAVVISSASGEEYAFESPLWKNGVFTYALLEGLKSGNCDADKSGSVQVSELKDYVFSRVVELTDGRQHPTSRKENLENDFVVW